MLPRLLQIDDAWLAALWDRIGVKMATRDATASARVSAQACEPRPARVERRGSLVDLSGTVAPAGTRRQESTPFTAPRRGTRRQDRDDCHVPSRTTRRNIFAMKPRSKHDLPDDDPTAEQAALDEHVDLADTDQLDDKYRVSLDYTGEFATGTVDHDDRGQARWKWNTESTPAGDTDRTFDLLKALNNDALTIEGTAEQEQPAKPQRKSGYDPYDVGGDKPKKTKPREK
jgi:hypothetical protein